MVYSNAAKKLISKNAGVTSPSSTEYEDLSSIQVVWMILMRIKKVNELRNYIQLNYLNDREAYARECKSSYIKI
jgi:hypothetical protein